MSQYCFFFFNQQFITRRAKADRGSYFRNYIHRKHTNRELRRKEEKEKERKEKELIKR